MIERTEISEEVQTDRMNKRVERATFHEICREIPMEVVAFVDYLYDQHGLHAALIASVALVKLDYMRKHSH